jgi:hypothetical protein
MARVDIGYGDMAGWMKVTPNVGHHKFCATGPKGKNKALRLVLRLPSKLDQKIALAPINEFTTKSGSVEFEMPDFLATMYSDDGLAKANGMRIEHAPQDKTKVEKIKLRAAPRPSPRASANVVSRPAMAVPRFGLEGRYFRVDGKPPITLQADEIRLVTMLIIKSGQVLTKKEAAELEPMPQVPIARLNKRLEAYRVCIEERRDGWVLANKAAT